MASAHPPEQSWIGWGDAAEVPALPESLLALLEQGLGVKHPGPAAGQIEDVQLPPSRLDPAALTALTEIVGPEHAFSDARSRILHTRGKSTPDLLRARLHEFAAAPDLALAPATHDEVMSVLSICSERRIAVVPFGGGTSVVGGLEPEAAEFTGLVALDLYRMDALVGVDAESRVAEFGPGIRGPQAEALLGEHGFTIGHFPQSFQYATAGGFAAARSSGQSSAGYGRFDDLVVGLRVATPSGTLELGRAPKSAAGPDLRQLILGSEGAFGVITSLRVQVRPAPAERIYEGWRFDSFAAGATVVRGLAQDGPVPTVLRLSDEAETAINLAAPGEIGSGSGGGALAIVGYEGEASDVAARRGAVSAVFEQAGAALVPEAGVSWARDRYRGPYLRDALLDAGALVETLETATFWSGLDSLYASVSNALRESLTAQGTPPVVLCHISHVYRSGASLYFTVGCAQLDDPVSQWRAAKQAVGEAILAAGGSITHHHGVGLDHRAFYEREIGPLGVEVLRAVKATLDPSGILNPGILVAR